MILLVMWPLCCGAVRARYVLQQQAAGRHLPAAAPCCIERMIGSTGNTGAPPPAPPPARPPGRGPSNFTPPSLPRRRVARLHAG